MNLKYKQGGKAFKIIIRRYIVVNDLNKYLRFMIYKKNVKYV